MTAGNIRYRLYLMITGWGAIGLAYGLTSSRDPGAAFLLEPTKLDLWFGFHPASIWIYLSFFALVPLAYFHAPLARARWLSRAMQVSALGAALVFILFPTTMVFPDVTTTGFNADSLRLLMRYDSLQNCLPSLHVTLTVLSAMALWRHDRPLPNLFYTGWSVLICLSILTLQRHRFVDLVCGVILAIIAAWLARVLCRSSKEYSK